MKFSTVITSNIKNITYAQDKHLDGHIDEVLDAFLEYFSGILFDSKLYKRTVTVITYAVLLPYLLYEIKINK